MGILLIPAKSVPQTGGSNSRGGLSSEMCFPAWKRPSSPLRTMACAAVVFGSPSSTLDFGLNITEFTWPMRFPLDRFWPYEGLLFIKLSQYYIDPQGVILNLLGTQC